MADRDQALRRDYEECMDLLLSVFFEWFLRAPFSCARKPQGAPPHPRTRCITVHHLPARIKAARRLANDYSKRLQRLERNRDTFAGFTRVQMSRNRACLVTRFLYKRYQYECSCGGGVEPLFPQCDVCGWIDEDATTMHLPDDVVPWFKDRSDEEIASMLEKESTVVDSLCRKQVYNCLN
jgi:hypothetical protein